MEALHGRRLLIQAPNFPAAGYGSGSCAITSFKAGRVSLSSSPISCHSSHSFAPACTRAKGTMNCTRSRSSAMGGNWLCPSRWPSPEPPREVKLRAGNAGHLSSLRSSSSNSWSPQDFRELLLVAWHTPRRSGRGYFVTITTNPFEFGHRRRTTTTTGGGSLSYKDLKISASSIFYWLKRNRKELLESRFQSRVLPNGSHWRTPLLHRFFRYTSPSSAASRAGLYVHNVHTLRGVGSVRSSTSDYYNGYSSVSSQAEGNTASLDNATIVDHQLQQRAYPNGEREEFLATGYGWRVRDAARGELTELIRVADIQTGAFHEKSPVFDELFYKIFHAEVLSSLQYKARHSDFDRYSCLLAERDPRQLDSVEGSELAVVGAVDITAFADKNIVCHLPGAEEYLYVSGMAVESAYRRQGVATLLLEGCLGRAIEWGFKYLVLHAYEDDFRARNLYSRAGYNTITADPAWATKFFGRRRRVVMARRTHEIVDYNIS